MFIIHLEHAPDSIRGELSLFSQEIAPFTFVSAASAKTRDRLWDDIISIDGISAVLVYTDKNEQKYSIKKFGYPSYEFKNFDGLQLVEKSENESTKYIAESLWAKLNPKKSLIDHMLETGIVAGRLINGVYKPLVTRLVDISGISEDVLKSQIVFICAMHDIGKCHPVFQSKDSEMYNILIANELNQESTAICRHEEYAELIIKNKDFDLFGYDTDDIGKLLISQIIRLHHQKTKIQNKNNSKNGIIKIDEKISDRWLKIQKYIYNFIHEIFPCNKIEFPDEIFKNKEKRFIFENGILGILITSDWIASKDGVFDNQSIHDFSSIDKCIDRKQKQASIFLSGQRLSYSQFPKTNSFDSIFHFGNGRPVQQDVAAIVQTKNIKLMLIESGCGSGKTEAALYAAAVLGHKNKLSGIYMGLPTGTSAEAIQNRVDTFFDELHMDKTKLYTSKSMLLRERNSEPDWTDESRQRLLAPSAVGTVDQVMTAARFVKFESVRMAGLSSKVLIIDEIHAYDAYMITVIERLLQICNALGVPVILLSATLPVSTKKRIFSAITGNKNLDIHDGYPLISYATEDGQFCEHQSESHEPDNNIGCEILPILSDHTKIAKLAVKNIESGGCECVIMNTVNEAISVYDEVKKLTDNNCQAILYHARMPEKTKDEKIKKILKMCGKDRSERPERAIIIGTQVLEQSIDIDVDYMITAICPIDLLLQRIGRYHRHGDAGTVREHIDVGNTVQILTPNETENKKDYGGTGYVYRECYLEETENVINEMKILTIPSCTPDVINRVYESADIKTQTADRIKNTHANEGCINIRNGFELYQQCCNGNLSDKYISVRESSEPTVQIAILDNDEMTLAKTKLNKKGKKNEDADADKKEHKIIELFKDKVVTVPLHNLDGFEDIYEYGQGIFKNVRIFDVESCANKDESIITIDNEYGFRILEQVLRA